MSDSFEVSTFAGPMLPRHQTGAQVVATIDMVPSTESNLVILS